MKAVIIAGAAVVAVLLGIFAAVFVLFLWASIPYSEWVKFEREKQRRKRRKRGKA